MSDQIISRIDEMGSRIDELESSIGELMAQVSWLRVREPERPSPCAHPVPPAPDPYSRRLAWRRKQAARQQEARWRKTQSEENDRDGAGRAQRISWHAPCHLA